MELKIFHYLKKNKLNISLYFFIIIITISIFLRFYNLSGVYTPYDDIAPIAAHKGILGDQEISIQLPFYKKKLSFSEEKIHNFEYSYYFPLYILKTTHSPPGRYLIYPLIFNKKDNYKTKIIKNRILSVFFSIFSIIMLSFLIIKINRKLNYSGLLTLSIYGLSTSEILLAHHGTPYSCYSFFSILGFTLVYLVYAKKLSFHKAILFNSISIYFSYLNLLFFLPLFFVELLNSDLRFYQKITDYYNKKLYFILSLIIIFPISLVIFSKFNTVNSGMAMYLDHLNAPKNKIFILDIIYKTYDVYKYLYDGFLTTDFIDIANYFLIFLFIIFILNFLYKKKLRFKNNIFLLSLIIFLLQWYLLYYLEILPLAPTRHVNFIFPIFLIITFLILNFYKINNLISLIFIVILLPISSFNLIIKLQNLSSNFDYSYIKQFHSDKVFTFYETLGPSLYFEEKIVYNLDFNSVNNNLKLQENDNLIILVSQRGSLKDWLNSKYPKKDIKEQLSKYTIIKQLEVESGIHFFISLFGIDSPNNFYFYLLERNNT